MQYIRQIQAPGALVAIALIFSPAANSQFQSRSFAQTSEQSGVSTPPKLQASLAPNEPLDTSPTQIAHQEDLGDLYIVRKRYLDAVNAYQQVAGNSPVVWNKLGIAYQHMFNMKAARASYEHALRLEPKYAEALNNMGTVLFAEQDFRGSARYYIKALKLSPRSAVMYANLGTAQFARGDYKRGGKAYRLAFRLDPTVFDGQSVNRIQETGSREASAMLNFYLAKFYARAGNYTKALECLRQALEGGFNDRKRLMEDEELAELRETQEFRQLMTQEGFMKAAQADNPGLPAPK